MPAADCLKFPVLPATTKVMSVCSRGAWFVAAGMRQETARPKIISRDLQYLSFIGSSLSTKPIYDNFDLPINGA